MTMRLLIFLLVLSLIKLYVCETDSRSGPCPGILFDSCECFHHLYDAYIEIINMTDIIARNWRITLSYQDISHSIQKLLHTAPDTIPDFPTIGVWPSVAVWASNSVGFSIRQPSLPELWSYIIHDLPQWMQNILDRFSFELIDLLFKQILQHAATALAGGNLFVFREIGSTFIHYGLEFCNVTIKPNDTKMTKFIEKYVCDDGQCDLAKGLWALFKAHYNTSNSFTFSERDQMLLIQGMYVGLSEQTHLQPFINASLPGYTINWCRLWPNANLTQCAELINTVTSKLLAHILFGSHRLLVDNDIPSNIHNRSAFSPFLTNLTLPETHDLMLKMLNSTILQLNNTAASDWNFLAQRIRFVAPLFWVFQDHEDLNCYLFSTEQEFLIRTNQSEKIDRHSWIQICDKDCCAANGRWTGEYY